MKEKNRGITLIVLIITIIIMLILVGVVIDISIDGKLIDTAEEAVNKTNNKVGQTQNRVDELMGQMQSIEQMQCSHTFADGVCTKCGYVCNHPSYSNGVCTKCGAEKILEAGEKADSTLKYTDTNNKTAVIPGGFTVSGNSGEKTIDDGLVIYLIDDKTDEEIAEINWEDETTLNTLRTTYDQFVWIPIKNTTDAEVADINDMFMCQSEDGTKSCNITVINGVATCTTHNSTAMAGRLYATWEGDYFNSSLTTQTYTDNSVLREPDFLTNSNYGDASSSNNISLTDDSLQTEYNSIVAKVCNSHGFWVGRYETSGFSGDNTQDLTTTLSIVKGKTTSDGINVINWYRMYKQQQNYASKKGLPSNVQSSMILGAAYDQIMLFANCSSNTKPTKNYSAVITGNVESDCNKNIYDLCGNLVEWTTEAFITSGRVTRRWLLRRQPFCELS